MSVETDADVLARGMAAKPDPADVKSPWELVDCFCNGAGHCDMCDRFGWYYRNADTRDIVSELMRDAMERHG